MKFVDLLETVVPKCACCGKTVSFWSSRDQAGYCSNDCYEGFSLTEAAIKSMELVDLVEAQPMAWHTTCGNYAIITREHTWPSAYWNGAPEHYCTFCKLGIHPLEVKHQVREIEEILF
jgi:hypothetical protein